MIEKHDPASSRPLDLLEHFIEDVIYGANDGIITTFVIFAGVQGARLAPMIIIIIGFVNLIADGISMGASRYLSIRAGAKARGVSRGVWEPFSHGLTTFGAFFIFGLAPMLSYVIPGLEAYRFPLSCALTGLTLFLVGALNYFISREGWIGAGLEMLGVGGLTATIAYFVGSVLKDLV